MREGELDAREAALAEITREASELARRLFSNPQGVKLKGKQDYITAADGEVERLIVGRIAERFPKDAVLGEEGGAQGEGDALWIIDAKRPRCNGFECAQLLRGRQARTRR